MVAECSTQEKFGGVTKSVPQVPRPVACFVCRTENRQRDPRQCDVFLYMVLQRWAAALLGARSRLNQVSGEARLSVVRGPRRRVIFVA